MLIINLGLSTKEQQTRVTPVESKTPIQQLVTDAKTTAPLVEQWEPPQITVETRITPVQSSTLSLTLKLSYSFFCTNHTNCATTPTVRSIQAKITREATTMCNIETQSMISVDTNTLQFTLTPHNSPGFTQRSFQDQDRFQVVFYFDVHTHNGIITITSTASGIPVIPPNSFSENNQDDAMFESYIQLSNSTLHTLVFSILLSPRDSNYGLRILKALLDVIPYNSDLLEKHLRLKIKIIVLSFTNETNIKSDYFRSVLSNYPYFSLIEWKKMPQNLCLGSWKDITCWTYLAYKDMYYNYPGLSVDHTYVIMLNDDYLPCIGLIIVLKKYMLLMDQYAIANINLALTSYFLTSYKFLPFLIESFANAPYGWADQTHMGMGGPFKGKFNQISLYSRYQHFVHIGWNSMINKGLNRESTADCWNVRFYDWFLNRHICHLFKQPYKPIVNPGCLRYYGLPYCDGVREDECDLMIAKDVGDAMGNRLHDPISAWKWKDES